MEIKTVNCNCGNRIPYEESACSAECYLKIKDHNPAWEESECPVEMLNNAPFLWKWMNSVQQARAIQEAVKA